MLQGNLRTSVFPLPAIVPFRSLPTGSTYAPEAFDRPPAFDHHDRKKVFDFPQSLLTTAATLRNPDHQISFLVSCGYFRATRRFFAPVDFPERDLAYVASQLGHPSHRVSNIQIARVNDIRRSFWIFMASRPLMKR